MITQKTQYRPEGWENPYPIPSPSIYSHVLPSDEVMEIYKTDRPLVEKHEAFEAGADAMFEGLRKKAVTLRIADQDIDVPGFDIVFIPEE